MRAFRQALVDNRARLLSYPNVVGVGLGYKVTADARTAEPALIVFVTKKLPPEALPPADQIPRQLADLSTDVVEVGELRIHNQTTRKHRPAPPGVSIGHFKVTAGTFGAVVYEPSTSRPLILSNNHVLANETNGSDGRAKSGDQILQPGTADGGDQSHDVIGRLLRFIPISYGAEESSCRVANQFTNYLNAIIRAVRPDYFLRIYKRGQSANLVDAALAEPLNDTDLVPEIMGIGPVRGVAEAVLGETVLKSGRTTGITQGQVQYVAATVNVQFSAGRSAMFEDQVLTTPMSKPGDSGSLVLNERNEAVGLLFAGSERVTICNRIQNVLSLLNVTF